MRRVYQGFIAACIAAWCASRWGYLDPGLGWATVVWANWTLLFLFMEERRWE